MSILQNIISFGCRTLSQPQQYIPQIRNLSFVGTYRPTGLNSLCGETGNSVASSTSLTPPTNTLLAPPTCSSVMATQVRFKPRNYWPFPHDWKRLKKGSFDRQRLTTKGRVAIFKRIIKGRHVLAH